MKIIDPLDMAYQTSSGIYGGKIHYEPAYLLAWSAATAYVAGNQVIYQNRLFTAVGSSTNQTPVVGSTTAYWLDAGLQSYTNIPTNIRATWSAATTYSAGYRVIYGTTVYASIAGGNLNHLPTDAAYWTAVAGAFYTDEPYPIYATTTTFAVGQRCILPDLNSTPEPLLPTIWESLTDANVGNTPYSSPTQWLNVGATNACKMYSGIVGEQSTYAEIIEVGIMCPSSVAVDSLALLNIDAASIQVQFYTVTYSGTYPLTLVYDQTKTSLAGKKDVAFMDIPSALGGFLKVTINNPGGTAKIGELIKGAQTTLGADLQGAKISIIDYSGKKADDFGNYTIVVRSYAKRLSTQLQLYTADFDAVFNKLAAIRSTPTAWICDGDYGAMILYGFYKSFDMVLSSPTVSECALEIEGMI